MVPLDGERVYKTRFGEAVNLKANPLCSAIDWHQFLRGSPFKQMASNGFLNRFNIRGNICHKKAQKPQRGNGQHHWLISLRLCGRKIHWGENQDLRHIEFMRPLGFPVLIRAHLRNSRSKIFRVFGVFRGWK
jgi:hypothetical protein